MCTVCFSSPCLCGCPNEEVPVYGTCVHCREKIPVGNRYIDLGGQRLCEDCAHDMPLPELLEYLGYALEENTLPPDDEWGDFD